MLGIQCTAVNSEHRISLSLCFALYGTSLRVLVFTSVTLISLTVLFCRYNLEKWLKHKKRWKIAAFLQQMQISQHLPLL